MTNDQASHQESDMTDQTRQLERTKLQRDDPSRINHVHDSRVRANSSLPSFRQPNTMSEIQQERKRQIDASRPQSAVTPTKSPPSSNSLEKSTLTASDDDTYVELSTQSNENKRKTSIVKINTEFFKEPTSPRSNPTQSPRNASRKPSNASSSGEKKSEHGDNSTDHRQSGSPVSPHTNVAIIDDGADEEEKKATTSGERKKSFVGNTMKGNAMKKPRERGLSIGNPSLHAPYVQAENKRESDRLNVSYENSEEDDGSKNLNEEEKSEMNYDDDRSSHSLSSSPLSRELKSVLEESHAKKERKKPHFGDTLKWNAMNQSERIANTNSAPTSPRIKDEIIKSGVPLVRTNRSSSFVLSQSGTNSPRQAPDEVNKLFQIQKEMKVMTNRLDVQLDRINELEKVVKDQALFNYQANLQSNVAAMARANAQPDCVDRMLDTCAIL